MVIGTGKELVTFAERHGAIISQHIWEALTDLDKCAPKAVVENCHSLQQLKAKISAWRQVLLAVGPNGFTQLGYDKLLNEMAETSAI